MIETLDYVQHSSAGLIATRHVVVNLLLQLCPHVSGASVRDVTIAVAGQLREQMAKDLFGPDRCPIAINQGENGDWPIP